jgi:hypothetical protein
VPRAMYLQPNGVVAFGAISAYFASFAGSLILR